MKGLPLDLKTIAIFRKKTTTRADEVALDLSKWARERGISVLDEAGLAKFVEDGEKNGGRVDLLVVLGGDGTLLAAARALQGREVPLLGVNLGQLGFLTEVALEELYAALEFIRKGETSLEVRSTLQVEVSRNSEIIGEYQVLNDAVLNKGALARISDLNVRVDGLDLGEYKGDGLIIATPTGSTAYSLSAGGPIVCPEIPAIVISPICPHTLNHRPIIVPDASTIEVCLVSKNGDVYLTLDGQEGIELSEQDLVTVRKSSHKILLIRSLERDFFQVLRAKLMWGDRYCAGRNNS